MFRKSAENKIREPGEVRGASTDLAADGIALDDGHIEDERAPLIARIAVSLLVAGCLVGVVWGFGSEKNQTPGELPQAIEALTPVPNALTVPNQSPIIVDLRFGYDADIIVDGIEIPRDQTKYEKATAVRKFSPGPEKDVKQLPGGVRRVQVIYYKLGEDRDSNGQSYTWTFTVT